MSSTGPAARCRAALACAAVLASCSSARDSAPPRTATEQMLISSAAERSAAQLADRLAPHIPAGRRVFVNAENFEGTDAKYAIGTIREQLALRGANLAADRAGAETVVEIRAGALSMDESKFLIGIPGFDVPIPLAGTLPFPEIALYKRQVRKGVAKFAAFGYDAASGSFASASDPQYGQSRETRVVVLVFFSHTENDAVPENGSHTYIGPQAP